ncbi:Mediator of RNA polymerase II transcription subunit 31, variant 2 [Balamuthia mandrillaris]
MMAGRGQEQGAYAKESSSVVEELLQSETPEQRTSTGKTQQDVALPPHSPFREEVDEFRRKKDKKQLLSPSRSLSFSSSHAPSLRPSTQLLAEAAKSSRQKRGVTRSLSSISPSSSLGLRLASKTHECLQEAEQCSGKEREGLLHLLLASLSAQVEEGLLSYIPDCDFGPVEEQQENQRYDFFAQGNSFALSPSSAGSSLHYYQLLASYYARSNSSFVELLSFLQRSSLWSSKPFPQIFACLFYRKLLQGEEWKEGVQSSCHSHTAIGSWTLRTPRGMHVFLKGTNRLFWQDLESGTTCFLPIFQLIKTEVLLSRRLWKENAIKKTLFDVFFLICRFFWYYEDAYRRIVVESESNSNSNISSFLGFISGVDANLDATLLQEVPLPKRFSAYNLLVRMQQGKEGEKAAVEGPENGSDGCMTAYSPEHWEENRDYTNKEEADEVTDNTLLDMPLLDVFVESIVQQIAFIKNEKILVTYLRRCALLKGIVGPLLVAFAASLKGIWNKTHTHTKTIQLEASLVLSFKLAFMAFSKPVVPFILLATSAELHVKS